MARRKSNSESDTKENNPCINCCHNKDKKRLLWKQGRHKSNKSIKYKNNQEIGELTK